MCVCVCVCVCVCLNDLKQSTSEFHVFICLFVFSPSLLFFNGGGKEKVLFFVWFCFVSGAVVVVVNVFLKSNPQRNFQARKRTQTFRREATLNHH